MIPSPEALRALRDKYLGKANAIDYSGGDSSKERAFVQELDALLTPPAESAANACIGTTSNACVPTMDSKPCTCPIERWSARFGDHGPECPSFKEEQS